MCRALTISDNYGLPIPAAISARV